MRDQRTLLIEAACTLAHETKSHRIFLFLHTARECQWFVKLGFHRDGSFVLVVPRGIDSIGAEYSGLGIKVISAWSGNQSRFSRIKYAFLQGVLQRVIAADSKIVCILGPWAKAHLDTVTVHDLSLSWSEEFPFDPRSLVTTSKLGVILAVVDVALDIGALGREGHAVGTTFIVGDVDNVMNLSHQAVFNPFKAYPDEQRTIVLAEVVESLKELAKLDGAFVISGEGVVEAAGRHLDARSIMTKQLKGLGSRHRAAAGITRMTKAVAIVVSESSGRVSIFEKGRAVATLEPVISRRLE